MSRPAPLRTAAAALLLLTAAAAPARSQDAPPADETREARVARLHQRTWSVTAAPVEGTLRLDGRMDEPAWQRATPITDFYQRERNEGLPATERTEVRVLYDRTNLYIGFHCLDDHPERVSARALFRDENGGTDDVVSIMLDSFNDHRSAIQFVSNANGLVEDLLQTGETTATRNENFDAVWTARGSHTPEGYDVEIAIPFKSLRFQPPAGGGEVTFGIGFKRNIPRKNEEVYWPFVANDSSWYRPAELGQLHGLRGVEPGRNLQLRPYALAGGSRDLAAADTRTRREAGFDMKWGVTTGLTADFTANTDFAQEEVDVQQINFTRFSLFFPEKRQLFLENEQMFQFGVPGEAELVFTRRIGLSDQGGIVPLRVGARLAGREGRTTIGALNMQTGDAPTGTLPGENFTVFRVRRDLFSRSSVGAVVTNRAGGGRFNRVLGADGHFFFKQVWFAEGFAAVVDQTDRQKDANALYGRFAYDTDRFGAVYRYLDLGGGFDPGVGFVYRRDIRQSYGELRYSPRPRLHSVRQIELKTSMSYLTNRANVLQTRERREKVTANFESGEVATAEYVDHFEFLDRPFALRSDLVIPVGTYRFDTLQAGFSTFKRRHSQATVSYMGGGFYGGTRRTASLGASFRPATRFGFSFSWATNWIDLPGGSFTTHLASSRVQLAFRSDLALFSLFQYNEDTRQLSTNVRFRWIPRPGSDLYVVYNELDDSRAGLAPRNRSLVVKLNYLFAL